MWIFLCVQEPIEEAYSSKTYFWVNSPLLLMEICLRQERKLNSAHSGQTFKRKLFSTQCVNERHWVNWLTEYHLSFHWPEEPLCCSELWAHWSHSNHLFGENLLQTSSKLLKKSFECQFYANTEGSIDFSGHSDLLPMRKVWRVQI